MTTNSGYAFISYSSKDNAKTKEIQNYLEGKGYKCWRAPDSLIMRGTQDYSNDIFEAIRNCSCLLLVLSDNSLCSDWARKEVKYAMERCHKPIIPYMVDSVPFVKYDTDELMISLSLQKQLLNEKQSGDMSVMLPYLQKYIGGGGENPEVETNKGETPKSPSIKMTEGDIARLLSEATVYIDRINELTHINFIECGDDYPFGLRKKEINDKTILAVRLLILAFRAIAEGWVSVETNLAEDILAKLYKLTYYYGDSLTNEIFDLVKPYAKNDEPWACFVLHTKYYKMTESSSLELTYKMLSRAVRDNDNPFAAIRMGICFQFGIGCDVSGRTAKFWYDRALEQGCSEAYRWLGQLYEYGVWDFEPKLEQAEDCYKNGKDNGVLSCYYKLGNLQWKKEKDYNAGVPYFLEGCKNGDELSLSLVADDFSDTKEVSHEALKWRATWVNNPEFRSNQALYRLIDLREMISEYASEDSTEKSEERADNFNETANVAFEHLIRGMTQKDAYSHQQMGDLMVFEVLNRQRSGVRTPCNEDTQKILAECWSFLEEELSNLDDNLSRFVTSAITVCRNEYNSDSKKMARRKVDLCCYSKFYDCDDITPSPFWNMLTNPVMDNQYSFFFSEKNLPSRCAEYHYLTPYRFIDALRRCPAPLNSELKIVQKIWSLFRTLDYEWEDCEQICKGHGMCLTTGSAETSLDRVHRIGNIYSALANLISTPNGYLELVSKLKKVENEELEASLRFGSAFDFETKIKKVLEDGRKLAEDLKKSNKLVRIAYYLAAEEMRYSDPQLDIALNCYRSSYMLSNGPSVALKMASLFFVHNGRFREEAANESVIYSIKDALFKAIYMREWKAVPLFLETALFGASTGAAKVEADFQVIEKADAIIASMIQEEKPNDKDTLVRKIQIALAMAKIYMDEKLFCSSRCEQKWGISTLLDRTKAGLWLMLAQMVKDRIPEEEKGNEAILSNEFWEMVNTKIEEFNKKGYVASMYSIIPRIAENAKSTLEDDQEFDNADCVADTSQDNDISIMSKAVESELVSLKDKIEIFHLVKLGDCIAELTLATDQTALLLKMAVEGTDDAKGLADDLVYAREELSKKEPDANLAIGIVCHQEDFDAICNSVQETIKENDLHVFKLGDLQADVAKVFIDFGDLLENDLPPVNSDDDNNGETSN